MSFTFKLVTGTDVGLRENNEDNFTASVDLGAGTWSVPVRAEAVYELGEKGALLMVADGMGGQNAGEVASGIATQTVQEMFAPEALKEGILDTPSHIRAYLKSVVREADVRVKQWQKLHPETEGMGSTIVLAWIVGGSVYVAWLGDSRAYSYFPSKGIARLSKDHSYVQELIDNKKITEEAAIDHPESNIITRSLGDPSNEAKPDVMEKPLEAGEIVMLCSDGLCGVLTDNEIASIIEAETQGTSASDLSEARAKLTQASLDAGGSDNITIALMQVVTMGEAVPHPTQKTAFTQWLSSLAAICFAVFIFGGLCYACWHLAFADDDPPAPTPADTVAQPSKEVAPAKEAAPQKEDVKDEDSQTITVVPSLESSRRDNGDGKQFKSIRIDRVVSEGAKDSVIVSKAKKNQTQSATVNPTK